MKRIIVLVIIMVGLLTGCNYQIADFNYTFNKAIIDTGKEIIEVEVESWRDYEDGDQIQVNATDGTVYLTSANKCVLILEGTNGN